jgi:glutamine synthetase
MAKKNFDVASQFGADVFNEEAMRKYLPPDIFDKFQKCLSTGQELDEDLADAIAHGMKDWAISKGATHYTHWFQPLTGMTAEKHDSFISIPDSHGKIMMAFSGKELIKGEPDASSFPSGGLRATFEARGYTAWDATSPAFVVHDEYGAVLYIPTAFCSYTGEALDTKTPLLRSMDFLSEQALRVLRIFGDKKTMRVTTCEGPEQEYFLLDSDAFEKRKDLVYTGRTLFGAMAPKGQELDDHYFGTIREKIVSFMADVNEELWKLGIPAKTEHNEVAPSQHELANIYSQTNIAADQNQMVMTVLKKIAKKHDFICLLAEKPFRGINGSGKHNNWSLNTDDGTNLLKPGNDPKENLQFLVFLTAVIQACDTYAGVLRESVATYGNDFRLGANEAPPAIISLFLGDELQEVVESLISDEPKASQKRNSYLPMLAKTLPALPKDSTDRNRTSPFAFTGNRFEFRMVGSEQNIAEPNTALNTIVAVTLKDFADAIEASSSPDTAIPAWIKQSLKAHQRIIFNGDGYSEDWIKEAERRGLPNLKTTVEATDVLSSDSSVALFTQSGVLSAQELKSRIAIKYDTYSHQALIDAKTMSHMSHKLFLPAFRRYAGSLANEITAVEQREILTLKESSETLKRIVALTEEASLATDALDALLVDSSAKKGRDLAVFSRDFLLPAMQRLRTPVDALELLLPKAEWPVPSYGDLLFHTI